MQHYSQDTVVDLHHQKNASTPDIGKKSPEPTIL